MKAPACGSNESGCRRDLEGHDFGDKTECGGVQVK